MHSACSCASQAPHETTRVGAHLDPIQEIGPIVGGGCCFMSGHSFARLWYTNTYTYMYVLSPST